MAVEPNESAQVDWERLMNPEAERLQHERPQAVAKRQQAQMNADERLQSNETEDLPAITNAALNREDM